ncbi:hypothetical protein B0J13DRAFT_516968 [Dactylonectria estremocensis]|uniref:Rhodopsin domain-containing protein n=1 Tax=Dactylonectria estremocensis TaxID=1079267 RepID=A0A9P9I6A5_9HYPO|nr:hypothetical protein B0J13DRAFT_516968 [Dactylonectria estremocensis]
MPPAFLFPHEAVLGRFQPRWLSLQPWCLGVVTSMGILMLVLVILRVLAFFQSQKPLSTDVCMVVLSFFWNLSVIGLMAGMIQHGVGLAVIEVPSNKLGTIERLQRPAEILYVYALAWTKISLLLLLRHIFAVKIKRSADILGGFIGIWAVAMTPLCIFSCNPILKTGHSGHCVDKASIWIANAVLKAISDCALLILPLPSIWRLKTGISQKILLTGQFGLGLLPTIASAYQFKKLTLYSPDDSPYTLAPIIGWSAIEIVLWTASACLPTLKHAFDFLARHLSCSTLIKRRFCPTDIPHISEAGPRIESFHIALGFTRGI